MKQYKKIYLEITNSCNLNCGFCPKTKRKPQFMNESDFRIIMEKIKGSFEYLNFHVMGEPLLHPKLGTFLDICAEYGYKVNITTNGTLIDKSHFLLDKPALRMISFSLHSDEGIGRASYLDNIFDFIDKSIKSNGPNICLRLWNLVKDENNAINDSVTDKIKERYSPNLVVPDEITHVRSIQVAEKLFLNKALAFVWPDLNNKEVSRTGFCYGLREQVAILVDGTVVPCCLDKDGIMKLGNIMEESLETITNSKRAKNIYDGFSSKKANEELCRKCSYKSRFK